MWCLIFKTYEEEYDAVPSKWVINNSMCYYPDKHKKTVDKLARAGDNVEVNFDDGSWIQIDINIIRDDFDSFERCREDALRMQRGQTSLTLSEGEPRGRGLRKGKRKTLSSSEENGSSDENTMSQQLSRPLKKQRISVPDTSTLPSFPQIPSQFSQTPTSLPLSLPSTSLGTVRSVPPKCPKAKRSLLGITSPFKLKKLSTTERCKMKGSKPHVCAYRGDQATINTIADALCKISRGQVILKDAMKSGFEDLKSRFKDLQTTTSVRAPEAQGEEIIDQGIEEATGDIPTFPIFNIEGFNEVEETLKTKQKMNSVVNSIVKLGKHSSASRSVTTILRNCLGDDVINKFSWKGQKRQGSAKMSFADTNFCKAVTSAVQQKWPQVDEKKIFDSISRWIAQTQLKINAKLTEAAEPAVGQEDALMD